HALSETNHVIISCVGRPSATTDVVVNGPNETVSGRDGAALLVHAIAVCVVPGPRAGGVAADRGKVASTHGNDDLDVGSAPRTEEDEITHLRGRVETALAPAPGNLLKAGSGKGEVLRSEEHTSELQSREKLVCRLLLEKKN